jgi:endonuclease/exonuclease/phosphatase family metal-dependent hydrolase
VRRSVLFSNVHVKEGAYLEEAVVLPDVRIGEGAILKQVVIDKGCKIPPGMPASEAVVDSDVGPLRVLTTHLEYYSVRQRGAQIDALRDLHAQACDHAARPRLGKGEAGGTFEVFPRPASAILCGDMNFPAEAPERLRLLAPITGTPSFRDAWDIAQPGQPHAPTVGIHPVGFVDRPSCFDFIFLTEDLAPRLRSLGIDSQTAASDHQPVWVELT